MKVCAHASRAHFQAKLKDLEQAVERGSAGVNFASFIFKQLLEHGTRSTASLAEIKHAHSLVIRAGVIQRSTFVGNCVLQLHGSLGGADEARQVFDSLLRRNVFSWTIMLAAYAQKGHLLQAKIFFEKMPQRDIVSWTTMVAAYAQLGHSRQAMQLFAEIDLEGEHPTVVTFVSVINACEDRLGIAKTLHDGLCPSACRLNPIVGTSLVSMYGRCKDLQAAKMVFESMEQRNVLSWTALLAAYARNGHLSRSKVMFERMPQRDVVAFNAMLAGFAQNGEAERGLEFFQSMKQQGLKPDEATFSTVLDICAGLTSMSTIHQNALEALGVLTDGEEFCNGDTIANTALVDLLGKVGCSQNAALVFDKAILPDIVAWNAMITANAQSGHPEAALFLLRKLLLHGFDPDKVTFVSILTVCSHAGLWCNAWESFLNMQSDSGHLPALEHYKCMVDMLGRLGQIQEAIELVQNMPFQPDLSCWRSLLSACKLHGDLEAARFAGKAALELEELSSVYVMVTETTLNHLITTDLPSD